MAKGNRGGKRNSGRFTNSQIKALEYYVSGEGMWINDYFRNGKESYDELSEYEKETIHNMDEALNQYINEKTLYRSVDAKAIFNNSVDYENLLGAVVYGGNNKYEKMAMQEASKSIGKTITEKGYISTTKSATIAEEWSGFTGSSHPIVMKIKTSKSSKGANISKASESIKIMEQEERILARNQSYKVENIYTKNGKIYVDVSMQ